MVGDKVLLKVSPMKGVMRFGKKGKLSLRFIGPFEILRRIAEVAYMLAFPPSLSRVNPVFHVSMLRKYVRHLSHVLDFSTIKGHSFGEGAVKRSAHGGGHLGDRARDAEQISSFI